MDGFQRRREKKMKSILRAAFELFIARGIKDVTMGEIAQKAGVAQASIYNFFQSKENLVRETLFTFLDDQMRESERVLESDLPFRQKMEKLLFQTDEATRQTSPEFFQSAIASDPLIQTLLEEYTKIKTPPFMMRLVEQGRAEGCINRDLSDEAILLYIRALQAVGMQSEVSKKARLDLNALFFYGLLGKPND